MRKKIVLVYDFLKELGGLERMMFFYANCLANKYDVELKFGYICEGEKENILKELDLKENIKISQIGKGKNELAQLSNFFRGRNNLGHNNHLIISFSFMGNKNSYYNWKINKTPYISVVCHPPNFLYPPRRWVNNAPRLVARTLGIFFRKSLIKNDKKYLKNAKKIVAISKYTQKRINQLYGLNSTIIYPPLSNYFKRINERDIARFKNRIGEGFILAHGRVIPDKNFDKIIPLIKLIDFDLIISGSIDKKYLKKLNRKVREYNLVKKIKILGKVSQEELLMYYNCAKVFVNPAYKEDFGLTMIEAMACGCPVVAWDDRAGPSEIIINNLNGFLVKPYDFKELEKRIKDAIIKKWDKNKIENYTHKFSEAIIKREILSLI